MRLDARRLRAGRSRRRLRSHGSERRSARPRSSWRRHDRAATGAGFVRSNTARSVIAHGEPAGCLVADARDARRRKLFVKPCACNRELRSLVFATTDQIRAFEQHRTRASDRHRNGQCMEHSIDTRSATGQRGWPIKYSRRAVQSALPMSRTARTFAPNRSEGVGGFWPRPDDPPRAAVAIHPHRRRSREATVRSAYRPARW